LANERLEGPPDACENAAFCIAASQVEKSEPPLQKHGKIMFLLKKP
jgi:hypothetical protein